MDMEMVHSVCLASVDDMQIAARRLIDLTAPVLPKAGHY